MRRFSFRSHRLRYTGYPYLQDIMNPSIDRIEAELTSAVGDDTVVHNEDTQLFHPCAVVFYNEDPDADFAGLARSKELFSTNLLLNENDDSKKRVIQRKGDLLAYFRIDEDSSGAYYVTGQAILCDAGTDEESVFVANALADAAEEAAEPLQGVLQGAREANLALSHVFLDTLRKTLFG